MKDLTKIKSLIADYEDQLALLDRRILKWEVIRSNLNLNTQSSDVSITLSNRQQSLGFSITKHDPRTYSNVRDNRYSKLWNELQNTIDSEVEFYKEERDKLNRAYGGLISLNEEHQL